MNIIFRCNAGSQVGFGHLVRCRVLAKQFLNNGHACIMVGPEVSLKNEADDVLFKDWIARPEWNDSQEEATFHIDLAHQYGSKHFILDDYRSDFIHQRAMREAGLRCLQQYDASRKQRFEAQLIINSSPGEDEEFYRSSGAIMHEDTQMLLGPTYSILRPEFLEIKEKVELSPHPDRQNRILVTFGGGDDRGAVCFVLESLFNQIPDQYKLILVVGAHNPRKEEIQQRIDEHDADKQVELLINPPSMPEIIASCCVAILGGGTTTFEVAFFGLPMILMPIATNQYRQGEGWAERGAGIYIGPYGVATSEMTRQALSSILIDNKVFDKMSTVAKDCVDGMGIARIIRSFIQ